MWCLWIQDENVSNIRKKLTNENKTRTVENREKNEKKGNTKKRENTKKR